MRSHKQEHMYKGISIMFGVRWSHALLALPFIVFLLVIDLYKQMGL